MKGDAEFIEDPTPASQTLLGIVRKLDARQSERFTNRNPLARIWLNVQIELYLASGWRSYHQELSNSKPPELGNDPVANIKLLLTLFERGYQRLIFNNYIIAWLYAAGARDVDIKLATKEDERLRLLAEIGRGEKQPQILRDLFGNYALDPYELSDRRFSEYSDEDIRHMAELVVDLKPSSKPTLDVYAKSVNKADLSLLVGLRELAKYQALAIVAPLRAELLKMAKAKKAKDPFARPIGEWF